MLAHPDGAGEQLQATTPRVPAQRSAPDDRAASRPRHAADPLTGEYPSLNAPPAGTTRHYDAGTRSLPHHPEVPLAGERRRAAATRPDDQPPTVPLPAAAPAEPGRPSAARTGADWAGSAHDETMVLPAFVTGTAKQPPAPSGPSRPDPAAKLSSTERGMLVFVAALLGIGTIAVVAMMGMGLGDPKPKAGPARPPVTVDASPAASVVPSATPSATVSPTDSPTDSPKPSKTAAAPRLLGSVTGVDQLTTYCRSNWNQDAAVAGPGQPGFLSAPSWACTAHRDKAPIDPTSVCRWQYQDKSAYTAAKATDQLPWKCYT